MSALGQNQTFRSVRAAMSAIPPIGARKFHKLSGSVKRPFISLDFCTYSANQCYQEMSPGSFGKRPLASPALPEKTWGVILKLNQRNVARLKLPNGKTEHFEWDDELKRFGFRLR